MYVIFYSAKKEISLVNFDYKLKLGVLMALLIGLIGCGDPAAYDASMFDRDRQLEKSKAAKK
jgi:hypothetical protein